MGAGLQPRDGDQRRADREADLPRGGGDRPPRQHPGPRRRAARHLAVPLPGRLRLLGRGTRLAGSVRGAERFARQTALALFQGPHGRAIPRLFPPGTCPPLPHGIPQGHGGLQLGGVVRPLLGPATGRGDLENKALRHDPRPAARGYSAPRGGLRRVADPEGVSDTELEHGHGLHARKARPAGLSTGIFPWPLCPRSWPAAPSDWWGTGANTASKRSGAKR